MSLWQALLLALVEGITEFLPISSTGHMIITAAVAGILTDDFYRVFIVAIQFGAILSVVVLYFQRFFRDLDFYYKLFVAFLPAAFVGGLLKKYIDRLLDRVDVVAVTLLLGGIVLLLVDRWFAQNEFSASAPVAPFTGDSSTGDSRAVNASPAEEVVSAPISYRTAFIIGCFQCVSMVPGVSRSAATIIGGLSQRLTRRTAAEFSFFLAVPTMFAATAKSLWDDRTVLLQQSDKWVLLLLGNAVAFVVALLAIRFFIGFLTKYGFRVFGYYRIVVGLALLLLLALGYDLRMV